MEVYANAKINLSLDVLGIREDGYHEVETLMQSIGLNDRITLKPQKNGITLRTNRPYLPCDERNLAFRAAALFFEESGIASGVSIDIWKKIPVSAGLAGGSTDAAAVLSGLNRMFKAGFSRRRLCEIGAKLGSDVPFCLIGGTALAVGRGEQIRRLPSLPRTYLVLIKPSIGISTPRIYRELDQREILVHPDTQKLIACIKEKDVASVASHMVNVLEPVCESIEPRIGALRKSLMELGALGAQMSGSGPTVFGIFKSYEAAEAAAAHLRGNGDEVIVTATRH